MTKATFGTGSFILMNVGATCPAPVDGLITTLAWDLGTDGDVAIGADGGPRDGRSSLAYAVEGSVFVAGAGVQWLRDGLGIIAESAELEPLARTVESSEGVVLVPAFTGLGSPHWDPAARGTITGLSRGTGRAHLARAMIEAMGFQVRDVLETMAATGTAPSLVRVDGGAAVMGLLLQHLADQARLEVVRPQSVETTALGAATMAGLAEGVWGSLDDLTGAVVGRGRLHPGGRPGPRRAGPRGLDALGRPVTGLGRRDHRRRTDGRQASSRHPWSASSDMMAIHWRSRVRNTGVDRPTTSTTPARTSSAAATPGLGSAPSPTGHVGADGRRRRGDRPQGHGPHLVVLRGVAVLARHPGRVGVDDGHEVGHQAALHPGGQMVEQGVRGGLDEQLGGDVQQLGVAVGQRALDGPEGLDGHAVHLEDLVAQQAQQVVAGQADPQLVDDGAVVALEDVDGHHVAAHRADPAGHGAEGAGSVGQLDADQVVGHGVRVEADCVGTVSSGLRTQAGAIAGSPSPGATFLRLAYWSTYSWPDSAAMPAIRASVSARSSSWSASPRAPSPAGRPGVHSPVVTRRPPTS